MSKIVLAAGTVSFLLSCLIAAANITTGITRMVRKRRGLPDRRRSLIHVLSIAFSVIAFVFTRETLGFWAFIPAIVDPATFFLFAAPVLLLRMRGQTGNERKGP